MPLILVSVGVLLALLAGFLCGRRYERQELDEQTQSLEAECARTVSKMRFHMESQMPTVKLSRRNLLSLLHKLEMPGSVRTLIKGDGTIIVAEPDEEHYQGRDPGPMHPDTEAFVADLEHALRLVRRGDLRDG